MYVDSHCHLDFPELSSELAQVLDAMRENAVTHALCISVEMPAWPAMVAIAHAHDNIYATVGLHPDYTESAEPSVEELEAKAQTSKFVANGETGLDYYLIEGDHTWPRERYRTHIRAARETGKPLVIHTRSAAADTLSIMREERAHEVGGVMHCFTETWDVAQGALDMGFHISFSGIVTFKNAVALKDVARRVPLERMLVETDSPYLAPVPHRGKTNEPAYVRHVAAAIAELRSLDLAVLGAATTHNFFELFDAFNS
jgi:TatD DNase family protein